jgi:hypothetical protein
MHLFSRNEVRTNFVRHLKSLDDAEMKFEVDASQRKNIALFVNAPPTALRTPGMVELIFQLETSYNCVRKLDKLHKSPHRSEEDEDAYLFVSKDLTKEWPR